MLDGDLYIIIDTRTGQQAASGVWSEDVALRKIIEFLVRQLDGGRPDVDARHLDIRRWREWGRNAAVPQAGNSEAQR